MCYDCTDCCISGHCSNLCFVAVIIYSPLVSGGDNTRIQQLEEKAEQPLRDITRIAGVTTSTSPAEIGL